MVFKITYKYDWVPKEFYFETEFSYDEIIEIFKKWNFYVYEIDMNFCFGSEDMAVLLNTYTKINFCESNDLDPYLTEDFELFSYEDGCEEVDLDKAITEEDDLRKILIDKMMKDFYEVAI